MCDKHEGIRDAMITSIILKLFDSWPCHGCSRVEAILLLRKLSVCAKHDGIRDATAASSVCMKLFDISLAESRTQSF